MDDYVCVSWGVDMMTHVRPYEQCSFLFDGESPEASLTLSIRPSLYWEIEDNAQKQQPYAILFACDGLLAHHKMTLKQGFCETCPSLQPDRRARS